jgi:hypothetical protein
MKFSSDSIKEGVSVMMIVTIEVINGRLMTKLVVVNQLLSTIFGITLVMSNINIIMILATICTQEKVLIIKKDAITWKVVLIGVTRVVLLMMNGAIPKKMKVSQEKTGVQKNTNGMAGKLKKAVIKLVSDMFLAIRYMMIQVTHGNKQISFRKAVTNAENPLLTGMVN